MKKYIRVACSVCRRFADRLVDNAHFTPDKCTITFRCEGRLFPVEYRSDGGITSAPEVGLIDWKPRTTAIVSQDVSAATELIDTSGGLEKQLTLAVALASDPGPSSTLILTLNRRSDTPKSFRQYVYRSEATFTTISGVESGLAKKVLRYGPTDTVEVYLNGVKLERGPLLENYELYDGTSTSAVPPNTVRFNKEIALPGVTQVDVIVAQAVAQATSAITFKRVIQDESRLGSGSWENVSAVDTITTRYYLFYCDLADATDLQLNTIMTVSQPATLGLSQVQLSSIMLLLARKPYSQLDRYTSLAVPLSSLSFESNYLKYALVDSDDKMMVTSTALETFYPPLKVIRFVQEKTIQQQLAGSQDQLVVDGSVIVGPDV